MTSLARIARRTAWAEAQGLRAEWTCGDCGTIYPAEVRCCTPECRVWAQTHTLGRRLGVDTADPWALPSPPPEAAGRAPMGWAISVTWAGWVPQLHHARAVHGCVTRLLRTPHGRLPTFAAWPCARAPGRWWLWTPDAEAARLLPEHTFRVQLGRDPRAEVRLGRAERLLPPPARGPGRYRVRLVADTPVVIRATQASGDALTRIAPEGSHIASTLAQVLAQRVGMGVLDPACVPVVLVRHDTRPAIVDLATPDRTMGGDGRIRGWEGEVIVEVSGLGAWLLECAAALGIGGRTAFGFGRVRVEVRP